MFSKTLLCPLVTQSDFEQNVPVIQSDNLFYPLSKTVGTTTLAKYKTSPFLNKSLDFLLFFCFEVDIYNRFIVLVFENTAIQLLSAIDQVGPTIIIVASSTIF